jgi:hypothetical protein
MGNDAKILRLVDSPPEEYAKLTKTTLSYPQHSPVQVEAFVKNPAIVTSQLQDHLVRELERVRREGIEIPGDPNEPFVYTIEEIVPHVNMAGGASATIGVWFKRSSASVVGSHGMKPRKT